MRSFAQKEIQSRKQVSPSLARPDLATSTPGQRHGPILHSQYAVSNQAVHRMFQTNDEERETGLTCTASPHFGHDFSRIPIHPHAAPLQMKLAINQPGDEYEQEADRVSEQVMRKPESQQEGHEGLQTKRVQPSGMGQITAPPIVHEALVGPGQPLDLATRAFFEPRFGYDLSRVRVHTDTKAAQSAQVVHGLAYTVGQHLVFGPGQYAPHSNQGLRLLAHELTHVVQQQSPGVRALQSSPEEKNSEVNKNPVPPGPGKYMPREYEQWLKKHPKRKYYNGGIWEPDYQRYTPKWFADRGYYYAGRGFAGAVWFEVWLNDTRDGAEFRVWRSVDNGQSAGAGGSTPAKSETSEKPPISECLQKFSEMRPLLWSAVSDYETNIDRLESTPAGAARAPIEADIKKNVEAIRARVTDWHKLKDQAEAEGDDDCANEIQDEENEVHDQLNADQERYNQIK